MPSFDIVSKVDMHELNNALDQTNREISQRYDFKSTEAVVEFTEPTIILVGESHFQIDQITDILYTKLTKRGIQIGCLEAESMTTAGKTVRQKINIRQGIDKTAGKNIIKKIKDTKLKVQTAIQGDQIRVTGKKLDDLQTVIALLKGDEITPPLQYINFRD